MIASVSGTLLLVLARWVFPVNKGIRVFLRVPGCIVLFLLLVVSLPSIVWRFTDGNILLSFSWRDIAFVFLSLFISFYTTFACVVYRYGGTLALVCLSLSSTGLFVVFSCSRYSTLLPTTEKALYFVYKIEFLFCRIVARLYVVTVYVVFSYMCFVIAHKK